VKKCETKPKKKKKKTRKKKKKQQKKTKKKKKTPPWGYCYSLHTMFLTRGTGKYATREDGGRGVGRRGVLWAGRGGELGV